MKHRTALVNLGPSTLGGEVIYGESVWSWLCSCGEYGTEHVSRDRAQAHADLHARTGREY